MADYKKDKDRLLLDQYQEKIRYIMEDRTLDDSWDWETVLKKFHYVPPAKLGIPEQDLGQAYVKAEALLGFRPESEHTPAGTMVSIRKLGKQPAKQKEPQPQPPMVMAARRIGRILTAHPESDIVLRAECKADGNAVQMDFQVGSGSLSAETLASMIRGAYGRVEYEPVGIREPYAITCYAEASAVSRDKRIFEQQEKDPPSVESWITTLLSSMACGRNYAVEFRFHPLLESDERDGVAKLARDMEQVYRELAFYSEVTWNNGLNGGGNISMKISALHNILQNLHFLRNATKDGVQAGENYSFSYGESSKNVDQRAMRLMAELEWQIMRLRQIENSVGWNVTISASASDEETLDAVTAIVSGAAERANFSLNWRQRPCCAMLASNQDILPLLTFPTAEFAGFEFVENEEFSLSSPGTGEDGMEIGNILWNGNEISRFHLPRQALNRHAFICGMTGAGKTNTLFKIIEEIAVPFLVIEPVKGEYRSLLGKYPDTRIWTMRTSDVAMDGVEVLQLNPFWFPEGANLAFHIDSIKTIISSAFDLSAAMPNIVEQCLYNVYLKAGWNIVTNRNVYQNILPETYLYPTFQDFTNEVAAYLDKSEFGEEVLGNYKGALLSRLRSFTNGSKGALLNTSRHPDYGTIMNGRTIMELEGLADDADKCLVMGTILVQYYQYLKGHFRDDPDKTKNLKHIVVIEEAHRLFKNVKPQGKGSEGPDPTGQLVESLSNIMAEIRAFGEGMLIVDQSPTKIAADVIKNSGTKIIHRIDHGEDIKLLQSAMLMPENTVGFSALSQGEALIRSDAMLRPCKVKIYRSDIKENYSLADTFQTGELKDFAINDAFVANTILQDGEIFDAVRRELKWLFRSLVWMDWNEWYTVVNSFLIRVVGILKDRRMFDRVQGRFQVLREIVSASIMRMFSEDGTKASGLVHMYLMRFLDFYEDGRSNRKVKPAAIEMMRAYFRDVLCGDVLFPNEEKLAGDPSFREFSRSVGLEDDLERSYLLYSFLCAAMDGSDDDTGVDMRHFLELNTLLSWERYQESYSCLDDRLRELLYDKSFLARLRG